MIICIGGAQHVLFVIFVCPFVCPPVWTDSLACSDGVGREYWGLSWGSWTPWPCGMRSPCLPQHPAVWTVVDRGRGILKSAGAFSFICCSPNSSQTNGNTTCLTTASVASTAPLGAAGELAWKPEGSSLSPISTLVFQMQTFRYFVSDLFFVYFIKYWICG